MIKTIFVKCLGTKFKSYANSLMDFEKRIADLEATFEALVEAVETDEYLTDKSLVYQYKFIADSNLMRLLQASSLIYSDSFKNRLDDDRYTIAVPCFALLELSRDNVEYKNKSGKSDDKSDDITGEILEARDWNRYWKDLFDEAGISKPTVSIEKKHILLADLRAIYAGDGSTQKFIDLKSGTIPYEMCELLGYQWDAALQLSPDLVETSNYDIEAWLLEGLK